MRSNEAGRDCCCISGTKKRASVRRTQLRNQKEGHRLLEVKEREYSSDNSEKTFIGTNHV